MVSKSTGIGAMARIALLAGAGLLLATQASAQVDWSNLSLTFTQPTGTVGPNDSIDVWLRFANNDPTEPFTVDNTLPFGGLNPANLPVTGQYASDPNTYGDFFEYTSFYLTTGFGCSGSFTSSCLDGPPYNFSFAPVNPFDPLPFTLAAGQHLDYLFGTFTPSAGPVAAGDYYFYRSVVWLNVYGKDAAGADLYTVVFPTQTCNGDSLAACQGQSYFTRTVTGVPEPGTYAMMGLGLALVGWQLRRRRTAS